MENGKSFLFVLLGLALTATSCSGLKSSSGGHQGGGGGTGTATVSVVLQAAPLNPPTSVSLLSFTVDITGISLTPASGTAVNLPVNSSQFSVDLTRLTSDSAFLTTSKSVPDGAYSSVTVSFSNPVLWYCLPSGAGTAGCGAGGALPVTGGGTAAPITTTLNLSANQQTGLAVIFNLAAAISISGQGVPAVDLAAPGVVNVTQIPGSTNSLGPSQLDFVEDVTGIVTAVGTNSVTVQTATRGSVTATANSSTVYSNCTNQSFACIAKGQVASIDTILNADGTLTLTEFDPLSVQTFDWIEGLVIAPPASSTTFQLIMNNAVTIPTGSVLPSGGAVLGTPVNITLVTPQNFTVDSKGLTIPVTNFTGTDASILVPGETVAVHPLSFTAGAAGAASTANANIVILRYSRVTGTVSASSFPTFSVTSLPPLFGLNTPALVQLSSGAPGTNYDGVTAGSGLTSSETVSMRALYFGPVAATPFSAAKIRVP